MPKFPSHFYRLLAKRWVGYLAHYQRHRNDEHLEALVAEAQRFVGLRLEGDLSHSPYWREAPLSRRVAVLLFLVDRGVVARRPAGGGRVRYEPISDAERWVCSQTALAPYLEPTLSLIAALRNEQIRSTSSTG